MTVLPANSSPPGCSVLTQCLLSTLSSRLDWSACWLAHFLYPWFCLLTRRRSSPTLCLGRDYRSISPSCENLGGREKREGRSEAGITFTAQLTAKCSWCWPWLEVEPQREPEDAVRELPGIHLYHLGKYPCYPPDSLYPRFRSV